MLMSATMLCQIFRLRVVCRMSVFPRSSNLTNQSRIVCRCLPLARLPCMYPVVARFSRPSFRMTCPKKLNCLFARDCIRDRLVLDLSNTSALVILSVHGMRHILLRNHISAASSRRCISLLIVHDSLAYNMVDHM